MIYIIPIILILFTISCSLDRTNPLDPLVSNINAPNKVTNIQVVPIYATDNKIIISWNPMINISGYYIYRSQYHNGLYVLIKDEGDIEESHYEDHEVDIPTNFYWYKMSAYIMVDGEKLEGYRSEPKTWN